MTTTRAIPTSIEIGLADSKEASIDDDIVEQKASAKATTTKWEERDSLREPLLHDGL